MTNSQTPDPFELVRNAHTSAGNYDMGTDAIINRLKQWQDLCSFTVTQAKHDSLALSFESLPTDMDAFARELFEFCPDLVYQGTGCVHELVEMAEETGEELPPRVAQLIKGIDFQNPHYGVEILKRQVAQDKEVHLWWD